MIFMSLYVRTSKEMCDKSIQYNFIHRDKRRIQEFTDSKSFVTNLNVFFCDFRMVLFLISLQMFELIKFCCEFKSIVPNFNINVWTHRVFFYEFKSFFSGFRRVFVHNFNTNVWTYNVLFRIEKFCSGLKSFVLVLGVHMYLFCS